MTSAVRQAFDRAAISYDAAAVLQRDVCEALAARLPATLKDGRRLLDAGCGTGYGGRLLAQRWPQHPLVLADFACAMLGVARSQPQSGDAAVCADVHQLPFAPASFELYWSSLTLQWCDLARSLAEAARVVAPGGHLVFSTLGPDTFAEIAAAFAGIDAHRHVLQFASPQSVEAALVATGWRNVQIRRQRFTVHYPDLSSLLRAIKDVGASELGAQRRTALLGRRAWQLAQQRYEAHRTDAGLPAHYDVLLCTAAR